MDNRKEAEKHKGSEGDEKEQQDGEIKGKQEKREAARYQEKKRWAKEAQAKEKREEDPHRQMLSYCLFLLVFPQGKME